MKNIYQYYIVIDKTYFYLPFRLGIGTTFEQQASGVAMDIAGDEDDVVKKMKSAVRW